MARAGKRAVGRDSQSRAAYIRQRQREGLRMWEIADELQMTERHLHRILQDARTESDLHKEVITLS